MPTCLCIAPDLVFASHQTFLQTFLQQWQRRTAFAADTAPLVPVGFLRTL